MNILQKTRQFIYWYRKGMKLSRALSIFREPLTDGDYYILVKLACICAILTVLSFADYIDGIERHADNMRVAAEFNKEVAIHHEATIASMLNGSVMINGRIVTMCQLNAAGECK